MQQSSLRVAVSREITREEYAAVQALFERERVGRATGDRRKETEKAKAPRDKRGAFINTLAVAYFPQRIAPPVSSALRRFTSVFGMGTGGATSL